MIALRPLNSTRPPRCGPRLGRRGATTVEFALIGGLVVMLLLGCLEIGRYLFTAEAVRTATAEAVRLVTLRGSQNLNAGSAACTNLSGALSGAAAKTPYLTPASLSVTMSGCASQAGVTTVTLTVQYPFSFVVDVFGARNRPIRETAQALFN